jgi:hypothetical protein
VDRKKKLNQQKWDSTAVAMDTTMVLKPKHCRCSSGKRRFSTLVTAVKAAGLVETLSGDGPCFLHRITLHLQNQRDVEELIKARKFRQT